MSAYEKKNKSNVQSIQRYESLLTKISSNPQIRQNTIEKRDKSKL